VSRTASAATTARRSGDEGKAREYFARLSRLAAKGERRPELEQARITMR
jgi:hypothetical protein